MAVQVSVGAWQPDLPDFESTGALEYLNAIPAINSARPLPSFLDTSGALDDRVRGAFLARGQGGNIAQFAGTQTKLYKLNAGGTGWDDVSRTSGGAYATASDGYWSFTQFGDKVIATNGTDVMQVFTIGSSTNFVALGGSPPTSVGCT